MRLDNKVSIITGASSGQGRAAALLFAREGASVVVADWSEAEGHETVDLVKKQGGEAKYIRTDVSRGRDVQEMVKFAIDHYGKLDILYNNAAISGRPFGDSNQIVDIPEEGWDKVQAVNLKGVFLGCKYAIPELIKSGGGSIINTASLAGINGGYARGMLMSQVNTPYPSAYSASKGGVVAVSRTVAVAYASHKIRCNVICPGLIDTPILKPAGEGEGSWPGLDDKPMRQSVEEVIPLGRVGTPDDIAYAALYLASDESSYVTGTVMVVDGGYMAI